MLAAALWLPFTGQVAAAHAYGGAAVLDTGNARAVALLVTRPRRDHAALVLGLLAGVALLAAVALGATSGYIRLADVDSWAEAAPALLLVAVLVGTGIALLWNSRQSLLHAHGQDSAVIRIAALAAWPHRHRAGLHGLGRALCALAETQQVTLDLTARTPELARRYARYGFTQPTRLGPHVDDPLTRHPRP